MKKIALALLVTLTSFNAFAALRADCVGISGGREIDLQVLARGDGMQLKSSALRYGNRTRLSRESNLGSSAVYLGVSDCNSMTASGGITEMACRSEDDIMVKLSTEMASIATSESLPLGESFSLRLIRSGKPSIVMSCETTKLLRRSL